MHLETKCWGQVWHVFHDKNAAISYLHVNQDHRCSWHWHEERANMFVVITGSLLVEQLADVPGQKILQRLGPGDTVAVRSGVKHRFRVLRSGRVVEVYWPDVPGGEVRLDDICRLDEGGTDDSEAALEEFLQWTNAVR